MQNAAGWPDARVEGGLSPNWLAQQQVEEREELQRLRVEVVNLRGDAEGWKQEQQRLLRVERISGATLYAISKGSNDPRAAEVAQQAIAKLWPEESDA